MAIDLSIYHIVPGDDTELPIKLNGMMDDVENAVNSGLSDIETNLTTLTGQITTEIDEATGALSLQITGELDAAVAVVEGYRDQAATSAGISTTQAGIATTKAEDAEGERVVAEQSKNQIMMLQGTLEDIVAGATAIVVSGDVSYGPAANQVPLARANGSIDPQWIKGALKPANWVEAGVATSGVLVPDSTEYDFTAQMARFIPPIFIPEVMTEEIVIYDDAPLSICITTDKKIRVNHFGVYESEPLNVNNDWVEFAFGKADNQSDTVTIYFIANGRQIGSTIVGDYSDLAVRAIFNDGAVAGFYGCASPAHQKQNSTATERINNPGDPVGYDYDLSPNGVNAPQPTSTARPLIARLPSNAEVRNLVNHSDVLSSQISEGNAYAFSTIQGLEIISEVFDVSTGETITTLKITDDTSCYIDSGNYSVASSDKRAVSIDVIPGEFAIDFGWTEYAPRMTQAYVRLSEGAVTLITHALNPDSSPFLEDKGSGRYRVGVYAQATQSGSAADQSHRFEVVDPVIGGTIKVTAHQIEFGDTVTNYQRRVNGYDVVDTATGSAWCHIYGLDDVLPRTLPAITDGTIIIGGKNGIWIDTMTVGAGTFEFDDNRYTSGPGGLYALIGDLVGWFVADATLTIPQETAVVNWQKAKGCPGVFELGANSYTESNALTESNSLTGVTDSISTVTIETTDTDGEAYAVKAVSTGGGGRMAIRLDDTHGTVAWGESNVLEVWAKGSVGDSSLRVGTANEWQTTNVIELIGVNADDVWRRYEIIFTAPASGPLYFLFVEGVGSNDSEIIMNRLSVKPITLNTGS